MDVHRDKVRREVLGGLGASGETLEALLAYTANPFDLARAPRLPLPDEPHLEAWDEYLHDATDGGVFGALAARLVQLRFPIEAGISQTAVYRAVTRRGEPRATSAQGLALERPADLALMLQPTPAGRIPVLLAACRADFVALVRACTARNEPEPVPDAMGACIVSGLNNWDRVARHRQGLESARAGALTAAEWAAEFAAIVPRRELYQDRFIILSREPYSAVPAAEVGLEEDEWRNRSVVIRREHECTHYLTLRAFGSMRNHLLDEVLADFAGLAAAFGRYDGRLALRFLGLDTKAAPRPGARFGLYLGRPALAAPVADVLHRLVVAAIARLETCLAPYDLTDRAGVHRLLVALAGLTLEELAAFDLPTRLAARLAEVSAIA